MAGFIPSLIDTVGKVLTGSQNAGVEAARIAAETADKREQRDHEINQKIMDTTNKQMEQAQKALVENNKTFNATIESMQATAREVNEAQRKQLADLLKEQSEKERAMADATIEERQAMRAEFIEARKEKEEQIRRINEENRAQIVEATRQNQEKEKAMQEEIKRLNTEHLEKVQEFSNLMIEQGERQRAEMNELNQARINDQREHAGRIEQLHDREIALTRGAAAAFMNMTISHANYKETAGIVELSNALRDSLSETRNLHHNAVESAQIALNDFNFAPASEKLANLGQRVEQVDNRRAEFVRALNRANSSNKELIATQMKAIGQIELALSMYRSAVGSLRAKMNSSVPSITLADIENFNAVQLELTKRMIEMPLIDANDVFEEMATNAKQALEVYPVEQLVRKVSLSSHVPCGKPRLLRKAFRSPWSEVADEMDIFIRSQSSNFRMDAAEEAALQIEAISAKREFFGRGHPYPIEDSENETIGGSGNEDWNDCSMTENYCTDAQTVYAWFYEN